MIEFNRPFITGNELKYISEAHQKGQLAGDGFFTRQCSQWLEQTTGCQRALLTHSCTAALEMSAILTSFEPGDEFIVPSFTFVSTANAFILRGGVPIFAEIRADTLNIDENKIEELITPKTKAIVVVHYAGVGCEMDKIMQIATKYGLYLIEDAAQAIMSTYRKKPLGSFGDFGCYSFHETKNIISGEGGALLVNKQSHIERSEVIREKGTNRSKFLRGMVDKYTWVDIGSSYLPGEMISAFLWAQIESAKSITERRIDIWDKYNFAFADFEKSGKVKRPFIPSHCTHNAHMYYLVFNEGWQRDGFISQAKKEGIQTVFHYIPLHNTKIAQDLSPSKPRDMPITQHISDSIVRLPIWLGIEDFQDEIIDKLLRILKTY